MAFPTVLVSDLAGDALSTLPPGSTVRFAPSKHVTSAAWDEIGRLEEASAWPEEPEERRSMYETLMAENAGYPDRVFAVRGAFSRVSDGECEEGPGDGGSGDAGGSATHSDIMGGGPEMMGKREGERDVVSVM